MAFFEYRWRAPDTLLTVDDYRRAAARRVPRMVWAYVDKGAEELVTMHDNRAAFSRWSLRMRGLTGHAGRDLSTTVAGTKLDLPVLIAPTGSLGLSHWTGDLAAARAAEGAGTRLVMSTASAWSIEEVAEGTNHDHFFQLYPFSGQIGARLMHRAWAAGFQALFVTVDVQTAGNREHERRTGMALPPIMTPRRMLHVARHPRWLYQLFRHKRAVMRNLVEQTTLRAGVESTQLHMREIEMARMSWDDLAWMREHWPGKLYVKGVLDPEDAERAVELGCNGVVVSNHGGRQLDFARASLDALPDVVDAVGDRCEVLLDGGVRRGTDVIKALALGARAVLIGRPMVYGLIVGGERGVGAVLDIFRSELQTAMALMGVGSVQELDRSWLIPRPYGAEAVDRSLASAR